MLGWLQGDFKEGFQIFGYGSERHEGGIKGEVQTYLAHKKLVLPLGPP